VTIKVLTLNVWHGGKLLEDMLAFLESENADILVVQEAYNDPRPELPPNFRTVEMIQNRLHYPATDFAPTFLQIMPALKSERGNAIFSRFPITHRDVTFFNEPYSDEYYDESPYFATSPRNLQHVSLNTPAGQINVFNLQGVWDLDGDSYSLPRIRMSDIIIQSIKDKPNVILAGDTNAKPTNEAILRIEKHLHNVFARELTTSFNMRHKMNPGYATAIVDMIFTSPAFQIVSHECPDIDISDHLPLIATLQLAKH
jgi:endonuclease/exonuclease/phosphatase family metal-dependent hydrolase